MADGSPYMVTPCQSGEGICISYSRTLYLESFFSSARLKGMRNHYKQNYWY